MTYHRGTLDEFDVWYNAVKLSENITVDGKVGFVNGVAAPDNQRTTEYSTPIKHPVNQDEYIWQYGGYRVGNRNVLTKSEVKSLGWLQEIIL